MLRFQWKITIKLIQLQKKKTNTKLPENGADVAHLNALHGDYMISWLDGPMKHTWEAEWRALENDKKHWTEIKLLSHQHLFGKLLKFLDTSTTINQVGPGIVWLQFVTPLGKALVCESVTPIAPMLQQSRHFIWAEKKMLRPIVKLLLLFLVSQYERGKKKKHFWNCQFIERFE